MYDALSDYRRVKAIIIPGTGGYYHTSIARNISIIGALTASYDYGGRETEVRRKYMGGKQKR